MLKKKAEIEKSGIHVFQKYRLLIIFATVLVVYGNTLKHEYSLDDFYVANNQQVARGIRALPSIFTGLYAEVFEDGEKMNFGYRPVVKATFALEYEAFGKAPHLSHFINLMIYFCILLLLYLLLKPVFKDENKIYILAVTLLFAVHPVHTEVVASLKNRDELLSLLLGLLTLQMLVKFIQTHKVLYILPALIFYMLGMLSKISIVVFVPLIPLYLNMFLRVKKWKLVSIAVALVLVTVVLKYLPNVYLPERSRPKMFIENPLAFMSFSERIPASLRILLFYLRKVFWPFPLLLYYGYNMIDVESGLNFQSILSFVIYTSLFLYAVVQFKKDKAISFGILLFLLSVSIYANLFKPAMGIVADRFLNLAVLGVIIALVRIADRLEIIKKYRIVIFMLVLIGFAASSHIRNKAWKDQITLLENDMPELANSAKANFLYAATLKSRVVANYQLTGQPPDRQTVEKIKQHLQQAVKIYPAYHQAWILMGSVAFSFDEDFKAAEKYYLKAISVRPGSVTARLNLAWLYAYTNQYKEAEKEYKLILKNKPDNRQALKDISALYLTLGDSVAAANYQQCLQKNMDVH